MEVRTYRAKSLQEALTWIRSDLGPEAAVLHTREVRSGIWGWLQGRQLEVTAGVGVAVPSRFERAPASEAPQVNEDGFDIEFRAPDHPPVPPAHEHDFSRQYRHDLRQQVDEFPSLIEELSRTSVDAPPLHSLSRGLQRLFTKLVDEEVTEESARELVDRVRTRSSAEDCRDDLLLQSRLARIVQDSIDCRGPIQLTPDRRRIVALVGPTGVGKTTTIAKLAAAYHLRERRRVGLVTVDTYRVAAVDQLRTYADIIDLPMEVVTTPREVRTALAKLADRELLLVDTSGHSPWDGPRLQELKSLLAEVQADELQLVLSCVASVSSLKQTTEQFAALGTTGLVMTKFDETTVLGHLYSFLRDCRLPLSYVTYGQNVPDDIAPANSRKLARQILGLDGGE